MMSIAILPEEVASQIAAGEVVERPASVVKELVENALDAEARRIDIVVEGAGRTNIEVADDGCGIPSAELPLAVARHATSKLARAEDLFRISSLGFRGEALASIASVSRVKFTSRTADDEVGGRLRVDAGLSEPVEPVGAPVGTLVQVADLFYNVPARLKFLKSDTTERRHIDELVMRYALAYPGVRFSLKQDGRGVLQTSGNGDYREVLAAIYGIEVARQMLEVDAKYDDLRVSGYISPLSLTRSNRKEIIFFVNGRWVQDPALSAALIQAYHTLLMVGRFPLASLFLELPPEKVDVNVHPAKAEVRFRERNRIFTGVRSAVRRALLAHSPVPHVETGNVWESSGAVPRSGGDWDPGWVDMASTRPDSPMLSGIGSPAEQPLQADFRTEAAPLLRLIGQVGAAYLVAEGPDGLYLIDQHAAHERVLFERFMSARSTEIVSQGLLEPVTIHLSPPEARSLENQLPILGKLGFEVLPFGPGAFQIRAVPEILAGMNPESALRVLVEEFEEDESPLQAQVEARIIARVCKRAAVRAGQVLSRDEGRALLRDLEASQSPRTCPHGRPTMIHFSVDLLERQFGRKG